MKFSDFLKQSYSTHQLNEATSKASTILKKIDRAMDKVEKSYNKENYLDDDLVNELAEAMAARGKYASTLLATIVKSYTELDTLYSYEEKDKIANLLPIFDNEGMFIGDPLIMDDALDELQIDDAAGSAQLIIDNYGSELEDPETYIGEQ